MAPMKKIIKIHQVLKEAFIRDVFRMQLTMRILKKILSAFNNSTDRDYNDIIDHIKSTYPQLPPPVLEHILSLVPKPITDPISRKKRFRPSGVEKIDCYCLNTFKKPDPPIVIDKAVKEEPRLRLVEKKNFPSLFQLCKSYVTKNEEELHSYYTNKNQRVSKFVHENPELAEENCDLIEAIIDDNDKKMIMIGDIETGDLFKIQRKH